MHYGRRRGQRGLRRLLSRKYGNWPRREQRSLVSWLRRPTHRLKYEGPLPSVRSPRSSQGSPQFSWSTLEPETYRASIKDLCKELGPPWPPGLSRRHACSFCSGGVPLPWPDCHSVDNPSGWPGSMRCESERVPFLRRWVRWFCLLPYDRVTSQRVLFAARDKIVLIGA